MVEQSVKALGIRFQARIQLDLFEELFRRRLTDEKLRIPKGMEADFLQPTNAAEERIRQLILDYRECQGKKWNAELLQQKERLARAERSMALRATKKAASDFRIASNKIAWYQNKLEDLCREHAEPPDARIFPQWYAPVVAVDGDVSVIRPMRYHLRPSDKPASIDQRFDGLYNARCDSLRGFWRPQFGRQHAVMLVSSFFENVSEHAYERRVPLASETPKNLIVHFEPAPTDPAQAAPLMTVACLWDLWQAPGQAELWSFAAITDEPPAEVSATGHDRCIVALREQNVAVWLNPAGKRDEDLFRVLHDREPFVYRHRLAG